MGMGLEQTISSRSQRGSNQFGLFGMYIACLGHRVFQIPEDVKLSRMSKTNLCITLHERQHGTSTMLKTCVTMHADFRNWVLHIYFACKQVMLQ